ncbi:ComEA family DNA-binding protein [Rufibacter glacialis]|uniref:ComEA family DNA-binding protein n=1 Tax=Rufibacter glacialis TaxID=1259555 RepID=A0A5M8QN87_9BACT|nr:helix-hairpin-helix domain-containing protein [Rufibacter glacialis]KAA6437549.1 transposase [Rufibacter glacialis]GGK58399.1 competence protein ComEA [Rufibacter glacialis]
MLNRLLRAIQGYFSFSQRELKQFFILIVLMVGLIAAPFLFFQDDVPYDPTADQQILDSLVVQLDTQAAEAEAERSASYARKPIKLYRFNPNHLTVEQWQELGLNKYIAQRILNYRAKAGDFKSKAQLQKIYGLPDSLFRQWYPYILLPDQSPGYASNYPKKEPFSRPFSENRPRTEYPRKKWEVQPFDLNSADTTQLKQIRGIGSKLSARIVAFREKMGGFHSVEQVAEVYGLAPEVVDSVRKYGFVPKAYAPRKLNLNTATFEELRQHPYIGFNLAKAIVNYRTQHGPYPSVEELRKIKILDEARFQKMQAYVTVP